jgi:predicted anti-sigma-YlaC factor YlaD
MSIFLKCQEANHTCDKTQYNEASLLEKIKLNIHLIYCSACRKYSARNAKLTQAVDKSNPKMLDTDQKKKMEEAFLKELSK